MFRAFWQASITKRNHTLVVRQTGCVPRCCKVCSAYYAKTMLSIRLQQLQAFISNYPNETKPQRHEQPSEFKPKQNRTSTMVAKQIFA
jgi:hypothetical protein